MSAGFAHEPDQPVYVISVAAGLAGMHAQTLRQYDRLGIVSPSRTRGGGRRYSQRDIEQLREVQRMSHDGISLAAIQRILALQARVGQLEQQVEQLAGELADAQPAPRIFAAGRDGQIIALRPGERPRRAVPGRSLVLYRS